MAEKEVIYLTDITLHTREVRATPSLDKAAEKGRMYIPLPKGYEKTHIKDVDERNHTLQMRFDLPPDLLERLERGEIELRIPKDGLMILAGRDAQETAMQMEKKERNELIHRSRDNTWHAPEEGI